MATVATKTEGVASTSKQKNRAVWAKVLRNPLGVLGLVLIILFAVMALLAPVIAPITANVTACGSTFGIPNCMTQFSFSPTPEAPRSGAILGVSNGYDIFFGIVWGTRTAFLVGIVVVGISLILGLVIGTLAGYFGGWLDNLLMRFTDILYAFPSLVLLIVLVVVLGRNLFIIMLAIAITGWGQYARVLRGDILKVKRLEYVDAARAMGTKDLRIIFKHVLPNSMTTLLVLVSLDIGSTVVTFAALSFLGIGAQTGFPDWGQLINLARPWIDQPQYWYVWLYPGVTIVLFVLAWNLLGDALRDATDPRSR